MDIKEIRIKRHETALKISNILDTFTKETGLSIDSIRFNKQELHSDEGRELTIYSVDLEIKL